MERPWNALLRIGILFVVSRCAVSEFKQTTNSTDHELGLLRVSPSLGNLWPLPRTTTAKPSAKNWLGWVKGKKQPDPVTLTARPQDIGVSDKKGKSIFNSLFPMAFGGNKTTSTTTTTTTTTTFKKRIPLPIPKFGNPSPHPPQEPTQPVNLKGNDKVRAGWFDFWGPTANNYFKNTTTTSTSKSTSTTTIQIADMGGGGEKKVDSSPDPAQDASLLFTSCLDRCDDALKGHTLLTLDNSYAIPVAYVDQFVGCSDKCVRRYLKKPSSGINIFDTTDDSFKSKVIRAIYVIGHSWIFAFCFVSGIIIVGGWLLGFGEKLEGMTNSVWKYVSDLGGGTDQEGENSIAGSSVSPWRQRFDELLYRSGQVCVYILSVQYLPDSVAQYIPWSDATARIEAQGRNAWMQHTTEAQQGQEPRVFEGESFNRRPYETSADIPEFRRAAQNGHASYSNPKPKTSPKFPLPNGNLKQDAGDVSEGAPLLRNVEDVGCELVNRKTGD